MLISLSVWRDDMHLIVTFQYLNLAGIILFFFDFFLFLFFKEGKEKNYDVRPTLNVHLKSKNRIEHSNSALTQKQIFTALHYTKTLISNRLLCLFYPLCFICIITHFPSLVNSNVLGQEKLWKKAIIVI